MASLFNGWCASGERLLQGQSLAHFRKCTDGWNAAPVSIARGWGYQRIPVAADLRRLLALPDRSAPPPRSPSSSSSASSPGTIASAVAASDFDDSESHNFHAQLERLGGILGLARSLHVDLEQGLDANDRNGDLARRAEWFGVNYVAPPRRMACSDSWPRQHLWTSLTSFWLWTVSWLSLSVWP
ncbi:hypothetical protein JG688_00018046 [Phytophthora aleatoria]|uniref:Uncharacterized protein n=1 Tax=Phytophthora aleatoria TaxID=2496075 RepID=A0A8J5I031_9STRA|nr:hypothetical protein JG688_00018046 [Phytophthora aleatoria]